MILCAQSCEIPTIPLIPVAPHTGHLAGQARDNQYIWTALAIEVNIILLEVGSGQQVHRALWDIVYTQNLKIKRMTLTMIVYIGP